MEPIAHLMASQLTEALGVTVTRTLPRAADTATLARALQSLVGAGMSVEDARAVVGL